jgi:glycine cleavage system H protein
MFSLVRNIRQCFNKQLYCSSNNIINRNTHFYTKTHEYIKFIEKDVVRIGITNYAKKTLGNLVYIELSDIDLELEKYEELATLESVKATGGMYAPANGTIISHNEEFVNDIEKYNIVSSEIDTWLIEYKLDNEIDKDLLLSKGEYDIFITKKE